ncbi:DUF4913 domain-containing protein [Williamsia sp. 1135]|uniref:DUF4913 domain-containing protein n=1 Tax=Williamsia sp. 1135 TaxID=1889262 RepID=UPI000A108287|nr:DUF4913 domain-containing protein [Williamsia sp. 1135]ORM35505.1 hypothetical protein BFL43_09295 [Williamsia sp. 1135]
MTTNEIAELRATLAAMQDQLARVSDSTTLHAQALDSLERLADTPPAIDNSGDETEPATETPPAGAAEAGPPDLAVLIPWVEANVSGWCERKLSSSGQGDVRWCTRWYEHPEAITRFWVLRSVQIAAAIEGPEAVSAYLRDHFDHHLGVLIAPTGPFNRCTTDLHEPQRRYLDTAAPTDDQRPGPTDRHATERDQT